MFVCIRKADWEKKLILHNRRSQYEKWLSPHLYKEFGVLHTYYIERQNGFGESTLRGKINNTRQSGRDPNGEWIRSKGVSTDNLKITSL